MSCVSAVIPSTSHSIPPWGAGEFEVSKPTQSSVGSLKDCLIPSSGTIFRLLDAAISARTPVRCERTQEMTAGSLLIKYTPSKIPSAQRSSLIGIDVRSPVSIEGIFIKMTSTRGAKSVSAPLQDDFRLNTLSQHAYALLQLISGYATIKCLCDNLKCDQKTLENILNRNTKFRKSLIPGPDGQSVYILNSFCGLVKDIFATIRFYSSKKVF